MHHHVKQRPLQYNICMLHKCIFPYGIETFLFIFGKKISRFDVLPLIPVSGEN